MARFRFRWPVWVLVVCMVVLVHLLLFGYMQNFVDMRRCLGYAPDPVMRLIPFHRQWAVVTLTLYLFISAAALVAMVVQAFKGREFSLLRLGVASSITSTMRMATLYSLPLCQPSVPAGGPPPLQAFTMAHLGFVDLPFRPFALNDLVFSGHTAIFLLILYATPHWPKGVRAALGAFVLVMAYGLIAMREHYTIDILLAVPCSFFADRVAVSLLRSVERTRLARAAAAERA